MKSRFTQEIDNLKNTNKKITKNESELRGSIDDLVKRLNTLEQGQIDLLESDSNYKEIPTDVTAATNSKKEAAENTKDETTTRNKANDSMQQLLKKMSSAINAILKQIKLLPSASTPTPNTPKR